MQSKDFGLGSFESDPGGCLLKMGYTWDLNQTVAGFSPETGDLMEI